MQNSTQELRILGSMNNLKPSELGLPDYPTGDVVGPCVCGSWPGGKCLRCPVIPNEAQPEQPEDSASSMQS